jgi:hypothetical protein
MDATLRKRLRNRKYGTAAHKRAVKAARAIVDAGFARCARCGEPIEPGSPVDVGHDDRYPWLYAGLEHPSCNRGAPHRNSVSREW